MKKISCSQRTTDFYFFKNIFLVTWHKISLFFPLKILTIFFKQIFDLFANVVDEVTPISKRKKLFEFFSKSIFKFFYSNSMEVFLNFYTSSFLLISKKQIFQSYQQMKEENFQLFIFSFFFYFNKIFGFSKIFAKFFQEILFSKNLNSSLSFNSLEVF